MKHFLVQPSLSPSLLLNQAEWRNASDRLVRLLWIRLAWIIIKPTSHTYLTFQHFFLPFSSHGFNAKKSWLPDSLSNLKTLNPEALESIANTLIQFAQIKQAKLIWVCQLAGKHLEVPIVNGLYFIFEGENLTNCGLNMQVKITVEM